MTIRYTNNKGLRFKIDVTLQGPKFVMVNIIMFSTRAPALIRKKFSIPYGHDGIIIPFDFNELETGIEAMIDTLYKDATYEQFRTEEMVEMIDILMMHDARVVGINLDVAYDVSNTTSA
ncbi:beta C1 protein [Papaya leaf curl China betasatellite [China:Hainan:2014]]|uniref:Beta C1 protein n=1 Tax=Papaya leaf curl China betasatellite [China:Hainan:2014] TaxID=1507984 RepID=A0A068ELX1_9VIRU|nr:beta C1 protein [Papaya leaf curl China betasatellite [China:Hainan:2014]]AID50185.1 beta C1 protein [Papaya leaf curl China betasatellite [China:Hainan:2014]]